ncbi:hypothetical protein C0Q70_03573 [Pomacea canaliculata]|uniref:WAP domain-containing protein n=1 Tax=Pomacea canaliculata TaxID=400727 RepID=A0A2T7PT36_POMCA|nr:hypothetical protein C0Q70_03573 [Pomacea canaliculata]
MLAGTGIVGRQGGGELYPSHVQLSPSHIQLSPSHIQLSPSHIQLSPLQAQLLASHGHLAQASNSHAHGSQSQVQLPPNNAQLSLTHAQLYQLARSQGKGGQGHHQHTDTEHMTPQCPPLRAGEHCKGVSHGCHQHSQCEPGAACCPDACGMVCKRVVAASRSSRMLPGSMLVQPCLDANCSSRGEHAHDHCDAEHACGARSAQQQHGGSSLGGLFGRKPNMRDMSMMMLLSAGT